MRAVYSYEERFLKMAPLWNAHPSTLFGIALNDFTSKNGQNDDGDTNPVNEAEPKWVAEFVGVGHDARVETPAEGLEEDSNESKVVKAIIIVENAMKAAAGHARYKGLDEHENHKD